jgi:hypothetical protein
MQRVLMSPPKQHRLFGCLAILHSAAVLAGLLCRPWPVAPPWFDQLWFGFATLWFFWPIVLLLHVGRSALRAAIPLLIAAVIAIPWWRIYSIEGATAFGLPMGCTLSPITMTRFFVAYVRGRADAHRDIRDGQLIIEVSGFGAGSIAKPLKDRYGVETRVVAGCVVDDTILGHERGYNVVSAAEIKRRSGVDILRRDTGDPDFALFFDEHGQPK